jgi:hypothetical protein
MAIGKQVAEFAFKFTTITYAGTATEQIIQGNCEGTVKLGGETSPALGTLTTHGAPGAKSGKCNWVGSVYPANGNAIPSTGEGTWEQAGAYKWRVRMLLHRSDGITRVTEGEIDLATRSYNGVNYEWN